MEKLDTRVNAIRTDLADIALMGRVEAARFAAGEVMRVAAPLAPLRHAPSGRASMLTEALFGELAAVFESRPDGWSWVQLLGDRYVGWMQSELLAEPGPEPTHKVSALRAFAFAEPDIKSPPLLALPFGARVAVIGEAEDRNARYAMIAPKGAVVVQHLAPLAALEADFVAVAERFLGAPYLWGGRSVLGLDCSGLVQVALLSCGVAAPRDADMQEMLGAPVPDGEAMRGLRRGDLVFWKGHVGIMRDADTLLHANAYHMAVASEPLAAAAARFAPRAGPVKAVRRLL